jgi:hypothetical protein
VGFYKNPCKLSVLTESGNIHFPWQNRHDFCARWGPIGMGIEAGIYGWRRTIPKDGPGGLGFALGRDQPDSEVV